MWRLAWWALSVCSQAGNDLSYRQTAVRGVKKSRSVPYDDDHSGGTCGAQITRASSRRLNHNELTTWNVLYGLVDGRSTLTPLRKAAASNANPCHRAWRRHVDRYSPGRRCPASRRWPGASHTLCHEFEALHCTTALAHSPHCVADHSAHALWRLRQRATIGNTGGPARACPAGWIGPSRSRRLATNPLVAHLRGRATRRTHGPCDATRPGPGSGDSPGE